MTDLEAMAARHSVRRYQDKPLEDDMIRNLQTLILACNQAGHLHLQLVTEEPKAFDGMIARYGKFRGVRNYIALVGRNGTYLDDRLGYYGEKLVLLAQKMGLNTCWVGLTYATVPGAFEVGEKERCRGVIAIGYGENQGKQAKLHTITENCMGSGPMPDWFRKGMEAVILAPSAVNQKKYMLKLDGDHITARPGMGFYTKMDLGIARCHFELGAGDHPYTWETVY